MFGIEIYLSVYIWALLLATSINNRTSLGLDRLILFIAILPASFIAIFRGRVGVDTAVYEISVQKILSGATLIYEPLFIAIINILSMLSSDEQIIVRMLSALIIILFYRAFSRTKQSIVAFLYLIFPIYFFEFSMNTLRVGLALPIFLLSAIYIANTMYLRSALMIFIASSIHLSMIIATFLNTFLNSSFKLFFLFFITMLFAIFSVNEFLLLRYGGYILFNAPEANSGVGFLLLSLFSVFILFYLKLISFTKLFLYSILFCFGFLITQFTYAGIRIQSLALIILYCHISFSNNLDLLILKTRLLLIFIGLTGFTIIVYRQFIQTEGVGLSPFLPYTFIF